MSKRQVLLRTGVLLVGFGTLLTTVLMMIMITKIIRIIIVTSVQMIIITKVIMIIIVTMVHMTIITNIIIVITIINITVIAGFLVSEEVWQSKYTLYIRCNTRDLLGL